MFLKSFTGRIASHFPIPGLGVGLFISAEIIEMHNGRIWAESTVGQGSQFYFAIPIQN